MSVQCDIPVTIPPNLHHIAREVHSRLAEWPTEWQGYHWPGYTWEHTLRVISLADELAQREGADIDVVRFAALLHDVCKEAGRDHAQIGAEEALRILGGSHLDADLRTRICYAIATHSGDNTPDSPTENLCLGDADLIDSNFGLVGVWRYLTIRSGNNTSMAETLEGIAGWLPQKDQLLSILLTRSGREIARQRSARMRIFCDDLINDFGNQQTPLQSPAVAIANFIFQDAGKSPLTKLANRLVSAGRTMPDPQYVDVVSRSLLMEIDGLH